MITAAIAAVIALLAQTPDLGASISGHVLHIGTNAPIRNARVEAMPSQGNRTESVSATTDSEGRFVLIGIKPGSYLIEVSATGFAREQYGQKAPTGLEGTSGGRNFGTVITLTSGQRLQDIVFQLTPTGSISGSLRDRRGRPAAEVGVYLLRLTYSSSGRKTLIATAFAQTDDRGDYRLYWITPGRYYVAASVDGDREIFRGLIGREPLTHVRFFPGVSEIRNADLVDVGAGAELTGINIIVDAQRSYAIRGHIVDSRTGKAPAEATLQLITMSFSEGLPMGSGNSYDPSNGSFEFRVTPGEYLAGVFTSSGGPSGRAPVTVTDSDVVGLVLTVEPSVTLPVKVSADHGTVASIPGLDRWRLFLSSVLGDKSLGNMGSTSAWSAEGVSEISALPPGTYRFPNYTPSPEVYFKEVRYGNHDALREEFPISHESIETLTILLGTNPGQIESIALNAAGLPIAGMPVVLLPEDRKRTDLYKLGTTDSAGRFNFRGLAPGDYKVFAWESIEPFSWFDPQVMERYESKGAVARVTESSKEFVTVRVIP